MLFFLFITGCYAIPYNHNYDYKLTNKEFNAEIYNNGLILNDKYYIKYNSFSEDNKYKNIHFNDFSYYKEYSISTVSAKMNNIKFIHEITENTTKFVNNIRKITKYENNKLYVSIYINNWKFDDSYNHLDFEFSIDNSYFIDNISIGINKFIIEFDENCIIDGYNERIYLSKSNNKYKLHFPSFENNLYYQFVISYDSENQKYFNTFIISLICSFGFIMFKFYNKFR